MADGVHDDGLHLAERRERHQLGQVVQLHHRVHLHMTADNDLAIGLRFKIDSASGIPACAIL